jgi:hypothetical protein
MDDIRPRLPKEICPGRRAPLESEILLIGAFLIILRTLGLPLLTSSVPSVLPLLSSLVSKGHRLLLALDSGYRI